ncbi:hypothetical protein pEaSNUABM11_00016 [Erwinia phage pEa_SNUABM_11]|nr:hypothetical protein pEaSNUABM11_00016 [Erwinia phage pEa_SNUABM_11]
MNARMSSYNPNGSPKVDAISSLQALGYTLRQAKNIRPWLPRQFGMAGNALPRANLEFWKAYEIVKDMQKYQKSNALSLQFDGAKGQTCFTFNNNEFLRYRSPTLETTVWSLEFVRHFGDGLWRSANDVYEGGPRALEYIGENIRLKRGELAKAIELMETKPRGYDINSDYQWLLWDKNQYIVNATESVKTFWMMAAICHSNLTVSKGWNLHPEGLFITKYQSFDPSRFAFGLKTLCELYTAPDVLNTAGYHSSKERLMRMHAIQILQQRSFISLMDGNFLPGLHLKGNSFIFEKTAVEETMSDYANVPSAMSGLFPCFLSSTAMQTFNGIPENYATILRVPESLTQVYTPGEWTDAVRNVFR